MATELDVESLVRQLQSLGVVEGDVLMVHASLRRLGPVEGGASGLVHAIDATLGSSGTWMMTLGAEDPMAHVNGHLPESERHALLADAEPFDPLHTAASADVGVLAEIFRVTPNTVVSNHPEGRFGARGFLAHRFMDDVPWHHYYGPGSPLERFVNANGKVLRIGADADTVTVLHYAEYLADVPNKRTVRRYRTVLGDNGPLIRIVECLDDEHGIVAHPDEAEDYFARIFKSFIAEHGTATGQVGDASCELLPARDIVDFGASWMTRNLR